MSVTELAPQRAADRTPPQDLAAEQSVLGAMMLSKDAITEVTDTINAEDYYRPAHETIHLAIVDLYSRGEPADAITVADELSKRGDLQRVGGHPYLHDLLASVSIAANARYYAEIVREKAVLRRLVEAATRIVQIGYAAQGDVSNIVDEAQATIFKVAEGKSSEDYKPLSELMETAMDEIESLNSRGTMAGIPSGFPDLDDLTNGFHGGQMVILAARPAVGKSTLGLDIARSASIANGLASVIFSLEMSQLEIVMRLISAEAAVPFNNIKRGNMTDPDWDRVTRKMGELSEAPLFIDDSPNLTMMEIRAKARRLKQQHDLKLIVIDYLQLMSSGKKVESRQLEVSEFSRQVKLLAKELDVPVIAISQLNRSSEQRSDKAPQIADLRESGSLEQDADVVILLNRPEATNPTLEKTGDTDFIVAKNRNGQTGTVKAIFTGHYQRFRPMQRDMQAPPM